MKVVQTDGFEFRFENALDAFVFDETDPEKPTFHGAPMKGVDIVAEFADDYVYVELKDFHNPSSYDDFGTTSDCKECSRQTSFNHLKGYLKYKFRDSYLYRHAEQKVEKPVHYICLTNLANAKNRKMQQSLKVELPVGKASPRWVKALASSCLVVNLDKWNKKFPKWPAKRIDAATKASGA